MGDRLHLCRRCSSVASTGSGRVGDSQRDRPDPYLRKLSQDEADEDNGGRVAADDESVERDEDEEKKRMKVAEQMTQTQMLLRR